MKEDSLDTKPVIEIYTDGGCEPNPGPGGYGVVLVHPKKRAEISGGFRLTTNNRMEIFAAIAGLEILKQPRKVMLYSDSQYVVEAMRNGWVGFQPGDKKFRAGQEWLAGTNCWLVR